MAANCKLRNMSKGQRRDELTKAKLEVIKTLLPVTNANEVIIAVETREEEPRLLISMDTFESLYEIAAKKWAYYRRISNSFEHVIAKDIYKYYVLDHGPAYWSRTDQRHLNLDRELRKKIARFIEKVFLEPKATTLAALGDVGKQKRKEDKNKQQRTVQAHVCGKCHRCYVNPTKRGKHEATCRGKKQVKFDGRRKHNSVSKEQVTKRSSSRTMERRMKSLNESRNFEKELSKLETSQFVGLQICYGAKKGNGLFSMKRFGKNDLICDYPGELLVGKSLIAKKHQEHSDKGLGSYMYEYNYNGHAYCKDATHVNGYGRYANHCLNPNAKMTIFEAKTFVNGETSLRHWPILRAKRDIQIGEEILHDYGDRDKMTLQNHEFLKNCCNGTCKKSIQHSA